MSVQGYDLNNSPFLELSTPFTIWEAMKMLLLLPTVPMRLLAAAAACLLCGAVTNLLVAGCDLDQPLPAWRRRAVVFVYQATSRVVLLLMGFWRPKVIGAANYIQGQRMGSIGIYNHVSYMGVSAMTFYAADSFAATWAFCFAGVTFHSNRHIPILGRAVRAMQHLYLPPAHDTTQGGMTAMLKSRALNRQMPMLSVAAEGTCSNGHCLLAFRTGAFVPGVPVVPILLRYRLTPHSPAWTLMTTWWSLLRLMCQFSNDVTIEVLPPYTPSAAEKADPSLYAANVRRLMAAALGVPMVDQNRRHVMALTRAGISVSWDGCGVVASPELVISKGCCDLRSYMPDKYREQPPAGLSKSILAYN